MDTKQGKGLTGSSFLFGAAIGAVLGMLFAPKKGSKLRTDVIDFGNDALRKGERLYSGAKKSIPAAVGASVGSVQRTGRHVLHEAKRGPVHMLHRHARRSHRGRGRPA